MSSAVADERTAKLAVGVAGDETCVFAADRVFEVARKGLLLDPAADLGASRGERANVFGVEPGKALGDASCQAAFGQEGAKRVRRGGEAAGHAHARFAELADHFAEGGVLAADRLDVGHSQVFEAGDEGGRQVGG